MCTVDGFDLVCDTQVATLRSDATYAHVCH